MSRISATSRTARAIANIANDMRIAASKKQVWEADKLFENEYFKSALSSFGKRAAISSAAYGAVVGGTLGMFTEDETVASGVFRGAMAGAILGAGAGTAIGYSKFKNTVNNRSALSRLIGLREAAEREAAKRVKDIPPVPGMGRKANSPQRESRKLKQRERRKLKQRKLENQRRLEVQDNETKLERGFPPVRRVNRTKRKYNIPPIRRDEKTNLERNFPPVRRQNKPRNRKVPVFDSQAVDTTPEDTVVGPPPVRILSKEELKAIEESRKKGLDEAKKEVEWRNKYRNIPPYEPSDIPDYNHEDF